MPGKYKSRLHGESNPVTVFDVKKAISDEIGGTVTYSAPKFLGKVVIHWKRYDNEKRKLLEFVKEYTQEEIDKMPDLMSLKRNFITAWKKEFKK